MEHKTSTALAAILGLGSLHLPSAYSQCQSWSTAPSGPNNMVWAMVSHDDGSGSKLYIGGAHNGYAGNPPQFFSDYIARWDGVAWRPVGPSPGFEDIVLDLAVFDSGSGPQLYAGGLFLSVNGITARGIARWDGSAWSSLAGGGVINGGGSEIYVETMVVHDDGTGPALFIAGNFTGVGSNIPALYIAKWDGAAWSALGSGLSAPGNGTPAYPTVGAMCSFDDGSGPALYVGGQFNSAGGVPVTNFARWQNGVWSDVGGGVTYVKAMLVHDDGTGPALYVGGAPTVLGTTGIARWDGSTWSAVGPPMGSYTYALATFDDGRGTSLYSTRPFILNGVSIRRGVRWSGQEWEPMGDGLNHEGRCMAVHDDGSGPALYVAGQFTQAGANPTYRVAAWHRCATPIDTLCPGDGTLAGCPCAPNGSSGGGCPNSLNPGGARLTVTGTPSADDLVLSATETMPSTVCLFFQGDAQLVSSFASGDGLRCTGGQVRRMYQKYASLGAATAPEVGDLSVSARATALGDVLMPGSVRFYQVYYRDPNPGFCAEPTGNTWNLTNGARVVW